MADPPRPTRRDLLRFSLGVSAVGVSALSGCALSSPTIDRPPPTPSPAPASASGSATRPTATPTATTTPKPDASAVAEQRLASLVGRIADSRQARGLSRAQRSLLSFLRDAHQAHAEAAGLGGPVPAGPKLKTAGPRQSLALLARRESAAAKRHHRRALAASGLDALVLGSMAVAASTFATVVTDTEPPAARRIDARPAVPLLTDVEAVQQLVTQLHAMVYGYQLAIGQLPVLSAQHGRAVRELRAHRILRDRQIAWLTRRSAEVPVAEPAYVPSTVPRDAATAAKLIRQMQTAFQPFCGLWLAAAGNQDRRAAYRQLAATSKLARAWGAPLVAWPGWPPP